MRVNVKLMNRGKLFLTDGQMCRDFCVWTRWLIVVDRVSVCGTVVSHRWHRCARMRLWL